MPELELKNSRSMARCIAVLGTASDVGKSVVSAALCRCLADAGMRVAPFKAQNMSNNSGVTPDGLEMGRAQIVQAEAAGIAPQADMNPILLKPTGDSGSQVIVLGKVYQNKTALDYYQEKEQMFQTACGALDRLRRSYDYLIMEGAGSCAEVNLAPLDIVNFRMAAYAQAPVILVADIHRGGVFAQIVGTLECLPPHQRNSIAGIIINRFRGDIRLFADGTDWITQKTGKPVFGVLPWFQHFSIPDEDSVTLEQAVGLKPSLLSPHESAIAIAVIRTPYIANFTDFQVLSVIPGIQLYYLEKPEHLSGCQAVLLPGSKNTRFDLEWLRQTGWHRALTEYYQRGGYVLGLCGGYQMLGEYVADPQGLEGKPGTTPGLSLLPVNTILKAPKTTTITHFSWDETSGTGYEIHLGQTIRQGGEALLRITRRNGITCDEQDGCRNKDGRVMGTYLHGVFDTPEILRRWLDHIGLNHIRISAKGGLADRMEAYSRLAEHFRQHINLPALYLATGIDQQKV